MLQNCMYERSFIHPDTLTRRERCTQRIFRDTVVPFHGSALDADESALGCEHYREGSHL